MKMALKSFEPLLHFKGQLISNFSPKQVDRRSDEIRIYLLNHQFSKKLNKIFEGILPYVL